MMKFLAALWGAGVVLLLAIFLGHSVAVAVAIGSGLHFIAVIVFCVLAMKEMTRNVRFMEWFLDNVRYGTVTDKNPPRL